MMILVIWYTEWRTTRHPPPTGGRAIATGLDPVPSRVSVFGRDAGALVSCVHTPYFSDMAATKKTAEKDQLARILDTNPQIDRGTLERSRRVEEQLKAVGIKLGGYRLEPPLGGPGTRPREQPLGSRANR